MDIINNMCEIINKLFNNTLVRCELLNDNELMFFKNMFPNGFLYQQTKISIDSVSLYKALLKYEKYIMSDDNIQKENSIVKEVILFNYNNFVYFLDTDYAFDLIGNPWNMVSNEDGFTYNNYYMPNFLYQQYTLDFNGYCNVLKFSPSHLLEQKNFKSIYRNKIVIPYKWNYDYYEYTEPIKYNETYIQLEHRSNSHEYLNYEQSENEEYEYDEYDEYNKYNEYEYEYDE